MRPLAHQPKKHTGHIPRHTVGTLGFISFFIFLLYFFSLLAQFSLLHILFSNLFSSSLKITLVLLLPYSVLSDTSLYLFVIFILNTALTTLFIFQIIKRVKTMRLRHLQYGLPASVLSILSIGCVACGALVTPSIFIFASGVPLFAAYPTSTIMGILASALLLFGNYSIYRYREGSVGT